MNKIRVIHLASFLGNIGDNANHQGFYKKFQKEIPSEITQLEIRKFYKNRGEMKFDDNFVKMVNSYDLMILGGGGFFDLKWDDSNTGTTIDFSKQLIDSIKIPVLINGMGYHEYDSISDENVKKFKEFLKNVIGKGGWLVSVRNDGSYSRLKNRYGDIVKDILTVPDHGFYYSPKNYSQFNLENKNKIWIGLNITNELFSKVFNKEIDTIFFNNQIGQFINNTLENDLKKNITSFPHAYQDIVTIAKITCEIKDKYIRERIAIAPLFSGKVQIEEIFDLYRICKCVIAMRFHGNVCPIGMNIPTIGLAVTSKSMDYIRN